MIETFLFKCKCSRGVSDLSLNVFLSLPVATILMLVSSSGYHSFQFQTEQNSSKDNRSCDLFVDGRVNRHSRGRFCQNPAKLHINRNHTTLVLYVSIIARGARAHPCERLGRICSTH